MKQLNWYQIFGQTHTIPDGRTVLPTDDIQIWLNCANIWDKTYTTLAEVLADTDTLSALIASNNAVDYMVRSTTWAVAVTVPVMTSDTTPSGVASASSVYSSTYAAYKAFNGVDSGDSNRWASTNSVATATIGYQFTSTEVVTKVYLKSATAVELTVQVKGSNDGEDWENVDSPFTVGSLSELTKVISNFKGYVYYSCECTRVSGNGVSLYTLQFYSASITDNATAMSYIGLNNYCANTLIADDTWGKALIRSDYWQSVFNVYVPNMTSNTTPSGVVSASAVEDAGHAAYHAFDNTSYGWGTPNYYVTNQWIQYKFPSAVTICGFRYQANGQFSNRYIRNGYIYASDNDNPTTVVKTITDNNSWELYEKLDSPTTATTFRMFFTNVPAGADCVTVVSLNFLGRVDV